MEIAVVTVIRCLFGYLVENVVSVIIVYIIHTEIYVYIYIIYTQRCTEMHMNADE